MPHRRSHSGHWPAPACWKNDPRFAYELLFAHEGEGLRYVFQTDEDQLLLLSAPPNAEARSWGRDCREKHIEYFRRSPLTAPLVEGNAPVGKVLGIVSSRFFYRRAVGPGFALVGDAGNYKDWVTGRGITEALLGAERLARAILDGRDATFTRYWRERDALTLPLYFDAQRLGEVGANDALARLIFHKVGASGELAARFGAAADRRISPFDAISSATLVRWVGGAALRGQLDAVASFLRVGRKMAAYQKEIGYRQRLFVEAAAALATPRAP